MLHGVWTENSVDLYCPSLMDRK